ncbi:response regulator [Methylorubrum suomiense]|jgi:CheY-like chemotaxis protein|uniref:Response regulator receiver protein CpdR n=1 Tax=Methylorubrum suomiense TaxID=144191 RepID=A0ABQ4USI3_9HYPH|nr:MULTISPECIES: response regulator [Methylobacteriaceae]GJE74759.1 Response regulator receiver protein CpdR [Methylorubrum suomiense]
MSDKRTVLVVEDEEMLLSAVSMEFEDAGYDVLCAGTAEQAYDLLRARPRVDLLFTDIRLPGQLDGWDLAERARALQPDLPVIYVTGYSNEQPRQVAESVLVMKPYRMSAIIDVARRLGVG